MVVFARDLAAERFRVGGASWAGAEMGWAWAQSCVSADVSTECGTWVDRPRPERCGRDLELVFEPEYPKHAGQDRRRVRDDEPAARAPGVDRGVKEHPQAGDVDERHLTEVADQNACLVLRAANGRARTGSGGEIELAGQPETHHARRCRKTGVRKDGVDGRLWWPESRR
jgi:hypothetical protein